MNADRLSCCIPGCRRTSKRTPADGDNVIIMCGRHWRMGDKRLRDRHKQLRKRVRWFERRWRFRNNEIIAKGKRARFDTAWRRAALADDAAWLRVREDVTIKTMFGAEDAPRKRGEL